jgi:hypothetical protein
MKTYPLDIHIIWPAPCGIFLYSKGHQDKEAFRLACIAELTDAMNDRDYRYLENIALFLSVCHHGYARFRPWVEGPDGPSQMVLENCKQGRGAFPITQVEY